jgi:hypothetical protein
VEKHPERVICPVSVFYSYSHHDAELRGTLERHLSAVRRTGKISGWHDRQIGAGAEWKNEIDSHLREADIVLLLVSADFLASDYCYDIEMTTALERHRRKEAVVIPVMLREVDITGTPLADLQALPAGLPILSRGQGQGFLDQAFREVAEGIRQTVDLIIGRRIQEYHASTNAVWLPQSRTLDVAVAAEIPLNESREITTMIRLPESEGLRYLLEQDAVTHLQRPKDRTYSASAEDVRSREFNLTFPLSGSVIRPSTLTIRISAPGFEPAEQNKKILTPTLGDSQPYSFSIRADREGLHVLNAELLCEDVAIVEQLVKTHVVQHGGPDRTPPTGGVVILASVPLKVMCLAKGAYSSA